jgi:hypothetical protein
VSGDASSLLRPATVCRSLLAALDASEGRRKRRARDTTPDAIGFGLRRALLERAVADDPAPEAFEAWLCDACTKAGLASGPIRAVAGEIHEEWRLASASDEFRAWLERGAPSADAGDAGPCEREDGRRTSRIAARGEDGPAT